MQRSTTMLAAEKRQSTPKKFDFRSFMKLISTIHHIIGSLVLDCFWD